MTDTAMTEEELRERLQPHHLDFPSDEASLRGDDEEETKDAPPDPRLQKEWSFTLAYRDGRGRVWEGQFVNKILSIRERQLVGITRARLAAGVPSNALDPLTEEINLIVAHLTHSLQGDRPKWAKDLLALDDVSVLQALYAEVASHEAKFFGWGVPEGEGEGGPGER